MKRFGTYRHIRKRALIFGLPLALFALQAMAVIGSLMAVIFSFGLPLLLVAVLANGTLYGILLKLVRNQGHFPLGRIFPKMISNKKITPYGPYDKHP